MISTDTKAWKYIYQLNNGLENLSREALTDGVMHYSYSQMFYQWQRYASVFSALNIGQTSHSRVGLLGTTSPEVIFSFYALNMVGAQVSILSALCALKVDKIVNDIKKEHLTDLILTDEFLSDAAIYKLMEKREELGLRNLILLHTAMGGSAVPMPLYTSFEMKAAELKQRFPMLYMDSLIMFYGNGPINYASNDKSEASLILHTSGTTGGSGKPIVLSDRSFNAVGESMQVFQNYEEVKKNPVSPVIVDLSNVFGMEIQVHAMLSLGATVVTIPGNALNPLLYKAIPAHKISLLFCLGVMIDMWMKNPAEAKMDFSSLKMVILGGSYVSAADKRRYDKFFREHGAKDFYLLNGYGISEIGGVCTISSPDIDDESIGYALPGYHLRFFDEDSERYLTLDDAPCTGVLYVNSEAMTTGQLDGEQIVKIDTIDGKPYVCTNDLIRADADGKLTYLGRANRFFLNSNGESYQSGRVETEFARQEGISNCGIVPVFEKVGHDTVPMLCVKTNDECVDSLETVRQALINVFVTEKTLAVTNIPSIVLIAEELPRNANGKIDMYKINRGEVSGLKYKVEACDGSGKPAEEKEICDIKLKKLSEDESNMIQAVYKGLAKEMLGDAANSSHFDFSSLMNRMLCAGQTYGPNPQKTGTEPLNGVCMQQIYVSMLLQQQSMFMMNWMNYMSGMLNRTAKKIDKINRIIGAGADDQKGAEEK